MNLKLFFLMAFFSSPVFSQGGLVSDVTKLANPENATPNRSIHLSNPYSSTRIISSDAPSTEKIAPIAVPEKPYNSELRGTRTRGGGGRDCGSRGGPGYRKANGKCASWKD